MDKQMIEEMAKVVRKYYSGFSEYKVAEEIYRILIPENAVVLMGQELDLFCNIAGIISPSTGKNVGQAIVDKIRKETADKFAERLKDAIVNMKWARDDTHIKLVTQESCLIAIDEICKEISEGE